jgi:PPOX class probable FMN-dependent enzyme
MSEIAVATVTKLGAIYDPPHPVVLKKQMQSLNAHAQAFIGLAPFIVISSADRAGRCDASPRGDAPGFVAILDDKTLLIPDRPGNNRLDSLRNFVENPQIGLLFIVPGITETLRVNGSVRIIADDIRLSGLAANGRMPKTGLVVTVEEAFFHCGKALIRSRLWDPEAQVERGMFASLGRILAEQAGGIDVEEAEKLVAENYRTEL